MLRPIILLLFSIIELQFASGAWSAGHGGSDPAENFGFDSWAYTWFLQKMVPNPRTWPAYEGSYYDIHVSPPTNEYTIHQTIIPTAFYWGFLAARR